MSPLCGYPNLYKKISGAPASSFSLQRCREQGGPSTLDNVKVPTYTDISSLALLEMWAEEREVTEVHTVHNTSREGFWPPPHLEYGGICPLLPLALEFRLKDSHSYPVTEKNSSVCRRLASLRTSCLLPSTFTTATGRGGGHRVEWLESGLQSPMATSSRPCADTYSAVGVR